MAAQSRTLRRNMSRSLSGDGMRTTRSVGSGSCSLSSNSCGSNHNRHQRRRPKTPTSPPRRLTINGGRSTSDDGIVAGAAAATADFDSVPAPPRLKSSRSWGSASSSGSASRMRKHHDHHDSVPPPAALRASESLGSAGSASSARRHHYHHHSRRRNNSGDSSSGMPINGGRSSSDSIQAAELEGVPPPPKLKASASLGSVSSSGSAERWRKHQNRSRSYDRKRSSSGGVVGDYDEGNSTGSSSKLQQYSSSLPVSMASAISQPPLQPQPQLQTHHHHGQQPNDTSFSNVQSESATTWKNMKKSKNDLIDDSSSSSSSSSSDGGDDDIKKPGLRKNDVADNDDDIYLCATSRVPVTDRIIQHVQSFRYHCGRIVNSNKVQLFIVLLIAINAIMMGIGTFDFVTENPPVNRAFEITDQVFLIIFTIELCMQFIYLGWRILLDGWLVFDLVIILTSWSFQQVQIIRAFRIFRALRLITRIKVMKNLILALFGVMPRMVAIGILLLLVSYIFAVMFTQLFKDMYELGQTNEDYFSRLDVTFFTLFQMMTLDNWAEIARQVMHTYSWAWFPIVTFVILTGFVVVNLIIAVICDAISALHDDEKAMLHGTFDDTAEGDDSLHPALKEDVRDQLDALETHVEELTRMQDETMMTLQSLAQHIQEQRRNNSQQQQQ